MSTYPYRFETTVAAEGASPDIAVRRLLDRLANLGFGRMGPDGKPRAIVVEAEVREYRQGWGESVRSRTTWHASTHITDKGVVQA